MFFGKDIEITLGLYMGIWAVIFMLLGGGAVLLIQWVLQ